MRLFPPRNRNPTVIGRDAPPGEYQWIRLLPFDEIIPKAITEMYNVLEDAQHQQRSRRHTETDLERQLRLQLTDAQKAVSALLYVRQYTSNTVERRQLTQEAAEIAQTSVVAYRVGGLRRELFARRRRRLERLARQVKAREERRRR